VPVLNASYLGLVDLIDHRSRWPGESPGTRVQTGRQDHGLPDAVTGCREKVLVEELRPAGRIAEHRLHPVLELRVELDQFGRQLVVQVDLPDAVAGCFEEQLCVGINDQRVSAVGLGRTAAGHP